MMSEYRFSPITSEAQLMEAIVYIHTTCVDLCQEVLGEKLPTLGNLGIFAHDEAEYKSLIDIREQLTVHEGNIRGKYYRLKTPISVQDSTYTHLYIRQPDDNRPQVGYVDFVMSPDDYAALKSSIKQKGMEGAKVFDHPASDMVELNDAGSDVLAYVIDNALALQ